MNRKIEGWMHNSKNQSIINQSDNSKAMRNTSHVIQRKPKRTQIDKLSMPKVDEDMFYDVEAMMNINLVSFDDRKANNFDPCKHELTTIDKNRPKLADILD